MLGSEQMLGGGSGRGGCVTLGLRGAAEGSWRGGGGSPGRWTSASFGEALASRGMECSLRSLQSPLCRSLQGGDLPSVTDTRRPRLYLLQWLKSDKALMMLFNDGTFQVGSPREGQGEVLTSFLHLPSRP